MAFHDDYDGVLVLSESLTTITIAQSNNPLDYGAPYTLTADPLPKEVVDLIYFETNQTKYHSQLKSVKLDRSKPIFDTVDVFCVNLPKDFPFVHKIKQEHVKAELMGKQDAMLPAWTKHSPFLC
jgi:hypothetical protein